MTRSMVLLTDVLLANGQNVAVLPKRTGWTQEPKRPATDIIEGARKVIEAIDDAEARRVE